MTITPITSKVTQTTATNGSSVSISSISGDWTLCIEVLTVEGSDTSLRFCFEDSVDAFTAKLAGPAFAVYGPVESGNSKKFSIKKADFPDLRFGVTSAVLRLALARIAGTDPSVTYQAWLES